MALSVVFFVALPKIVGIWLNFLIFFLESSNENMLVYFPNKSYLSLYIKRLAN